MSEAQLEAVLVGVSIVVLSAGLIALLRAATHWIARSVVEDVRASVRDMVAPLVFELQPNGGKSALDQVIQRVDGVGAEVAYLTRQVEAMNERFEEHVDTAAAIVEELRGEIEANGNHDKDG